MDIPERVKGANGIRVPAEQAMSHPNRYKDLGLQFGWKPERVSVITKALQALLLDRWGHLLEFDYERLSKERLQLFADVIHDRGAPLTTCWGFIDSTIRQIARPIRF